MKRTHSEALIWSADLHLERILEKRRYFVYSLKKTDQTLWYAKFAPITCFFVRNCRNKQDLLLFIMNIVHIFHFKTIFSVQPHHWGGRFCYQILIWWTNYVHVWVLEEYEGWIAFDFYSLSGLYMKKHTISENLPLKWLTNGCSFGTPEVRILFLPVRFVRSECELPGRDMYRST